MMTAKIAHKMLSSRRPYINEAAASGVLAGALALAAGIVLQGCASMQEETSGPAYAEPSQILAAPFDPAQALQTDAGTMDLSSVNQGYAVASATADGRLKLQVLCGPMSYVYELPQNGDPITVPMNMGSGTYTFRIMMNTSGSDYVELGRQTADVVLDSEFEPFLRPNVYCQYTADSACVAKAHELAADAENEGDVVRSVYNWLSSSFTYDSEKAADLANATGYVPNPDQMFAAGKGICFDYASLAAAMFRSLGIPCKIVTGYVEPDGVYHAWNMIYIDGRWVSAEITVEANEWCRIDLTFASAGVSEESAKEELTYTDRYIY